MKTYIQPQTTAITYDFQGALMNMSVNEAGEGTISIGTGTVTGAFSQEMDEYSEEE